MIFVVLGAGVLIRCFLVHFTYPVMYHIGNMHEICKDFEVATSLYVYSVNWHFFLQKYLLHLLW